jgi:hypothetical protein
MLAAQLRRDTWGESIKSSSMSVSAAGRIRQSADNQVARSKKDYFTAHGLQNKFAPLGTCSARPTSRSSSHRAMTGTSLRYAPSLRLTSSPEPTSSSSLAMTSSFATMADRTWLTWPLSRAAAEVPDALAAATVPGTEPTATASSTRGQPRVTNYSISCSKSAAATASQLRASAAPRCPPTPSSPSPATTTY